MATNNNNLPARTYTKQFAQLMQTVFGVQSVFAPTFGALQALDGVQNNATAFSVKTNDVPVVAGYRLTKNNKWVICVWSYLCECVGGAGNRI